MTQPYRMPAQALACASTPSKPWRCYLGLHFLYSFSISDSRCFICDGMRIRFYCACGRMLKEVHKPTNRPVTIKISSDWDGMGGH